MGGSVGIFLEGTLVTIGTGLFGVIGDSAHAATKVLGYPGAEINGLLAWWVPPEFALGGLAAAIVLPVFLSAIAKLFNTPEKLMYEQPTRRIIATCLLALGNYLLSSLLYSLGVNDRMISAALISGTISTWLMSGALLPILFSGLFWGLGGVLWEATLCRLELFWYYSPDFIGVRHWIYWLWVSALIALSASVMHLNTTKPSPTAATSSSSSNVKKAL